MKLADTLAVELEDLTEKLEQILHEKLPDAARAVNQEGEGISALRGIVAELDDLQRALGMKTFELLRSGHSLTEKPPNPPGLRDADWPGVDPPLGAPPPRTTPPPEPDLSRICSDARCNVTAGVIVCPACQKLYCPRHHDPALHPCAGDFPE